MFSLSCRLRGILSSGLLGLRSQACSTFFRPLLHEQLAQASKTGRPGLTGFEAAKPVKSALKKQQ